MIKMIGEAPRVDVWANYWPRSLFDSFPPLQDLYFRFGLGDRMDLTAASLTKAAQEAGLDRVLLSATVFPGSPVGNDVVADVVRAAPDLLKGCASVDPRTGMAAIAELRRAVEESGFVALKLLPFLYGEAPDAAIYFPLYAACVELGIPVLILTGHTAVARPNHTGQPGAIDPIALHFPELTIIAGHAGHPWTNELVALSWKHDNVYIDLSGHRPLQITTDVQCRSFT